MNIITEDNLLLKLKADAFDKLWEILKNTPSEQLPDSLFLFRESHRAWTFKDE